MSELNFTRKTFLEREELRRLQEFLRDDTTFNAIIGNTRQYGIIQTNFVGSDPNFQVGTGTNAGTIQIANERSQALDIDGALIRLLARDNIAVPNDSAWYWVRISHEFRRYEEGTVSINANGQLVGSGTAFLEVLRGQATDVPVRVRFEELDGTAANNNGIYEVVNVVDGTNAVLTSVTGFQVEANLRFIVIGSTPIGEIVSPEQLTGLYNYDSCLIELVAETTLDSPPALPANGANRFFYIARVMNAATVVTIQDRRSIDTNYWQFNIPGVTGAIINRGIPAPTALDQYLMLGFIGKGGSQFEHFLFTGADSLAGYIAWIRVTRILETGIDIAGVNVSVIRDTGQPTHNPTFFVRDNTVDDRFELWVRGPAALVGPGASMMPGVISLVSENLTAAATTWEYAGVFSWDVTVPSDLTEAVTIYTVYANDGTNIAINDTINSLATRLSAVDSDTGQRSWVFDNPGGGFFENARGSVRQIGNVVSCTGEFDIPAAPGGGIFGSLTFGTLPTNIDPPSVLTFFAASYAENVDALSFSGRIIANSRDVDIVVSVPGGRSATNVSFNVTYLV